MSTYVMDIETNGLLLDATTIWCIVLKNIDTSEVGVYYDKESLKAVLKDSDKLILHNGIMYDLPVLERLWGIKYKVNQIYDTLLMSRVLEPDREGGHSLEAWGNRVGLTKIDYTEFNNPDMDKLVEYCIGDVEITHRVYNKLQESLLTGEFIRLERQFAYLIEKQIEAGFAFDEAYANDLYLKYNMEFELYKSQLLLEMPKVEDTTHYKSIVAKGALISESAESYTYLSRNKVITKARKYTEPNPTSRQQIADYLINKGWEPTVFTETGLPKVDESSLKGVEGAEGIVRMFTLQKKMGMLKDGQYGWLNCVRNGRIHGDVITNGTSTGRCTHSKPNVAQTDGDPEMRRCWVAGTGKVLVGVDASSLELRVLSHYLSIYDRGSFAHEVVEGDVHTYNQQVMGLETRTDAKTAIYALIYGAGNAKLGFIKTKERDEDMNKIVGQQVRSNIEDNFIGYKQLVDDVQTTFKNRGYLRGLDGRPLYPRSDYSALNLLIQSAGAIIMKQALVNSFKILLDRGYKLGVHYNYVGNIHDEIQIECDEEIGEEVGKCVVEAIVKSGEDFKLKCPMNGEMKIGKSWDQTH